MAERNKLSDKLRQEEQLPQGFSWDQMEDGINARLKASHNPSLIIKIVRTLTIGVVSISLAAFVFYFTNNQHTSQPTSESLESIKKDQIIDNKNKTNSISPEDSPIEKSIKNKNTTSITEVSGSNQVQQLSAGLDRAIPSLPVTSQVETSRAEESTVAFSSQESHESGSGNLSRGNRALSDENDVTKNATSVTDYAALPLAQNSSVSGLSEQSSSNVVATNTHTPQVTNATTKEAESSTDLVLTAAGSSQAITAAAKIKINELQTLSILKQQLFFSRPSLNLPNDLISQQLVIEPAKNNITSSKFSAELTVGSNLWSLTGANGLVAEKTAQSENALPGLSTNLCIAYAINNKWSIATGLGYRTLSSKLSFEEVYDTTTTENIVTLQLISPIDGSVLNEYRDDVDLTREVTYRLVHYNKYTRWSIPVLVRRTFFPDNKFNVFLGAGVSYGIAGSATGKILTDNPHDYRELQSSSLADDLTHKLEAIAEVGFNWKIDKGISITGRLTGNQNISPLSYFEKMDYNKMIISSQLGLRYSF